MITKPTLYKRTSGGKIQIWFMEIDEDKFRATSGQEDGKKTTSVWKIAKPKNVGKANATTGPEQALAEVESIYANKLKGDYVESLDDVDVITRVKPMLADKWKDRKDKILDDNVHIQPKLDGIRCIGGLDQLTSRGNEEIVGAPHILEELQLIKDDYPDMFPVDGELYNHEYKDDFNELQSAIMKKKPDPEALALSEKVVEYWLYDLPMHKGNTPERMKKLEEMFNLLIERGAKNIKLTSTYRIHRSEVDETSEKFIEDGYEGSMIRYEDAIYENKRSKKLLKWKEFQDAEFEIADIVEGEGNRYGWAAKVICLTKDGQRFGAGILGNEKYCRQLLIEKDKWIGKMGTIVFQNYTPDGIPRFAKFKAVRLDLG